MQDLFTQKTQSSLIPIHAIIFQDFESWKKSQSDYIQRWITIMHFKAKSGSYCIIPSQNGQLDSVLLGIKNQADFLAFGVL